MTDSQNNPLPEGWCGTVISSLFEMKYGKGLKAEKRNNSGPFHVYGSNGVVGLHDQPITAGPTIIVGRKGSVGEVHLSQSACWPIDTTYYIDDFPSGLPTQYWAFFLKSLRLGQQDKSSAIPGISREDIYALPIPLPPLAEQRRIVAKLDAVLGKVEACRQRLDRLPALLKRFRQAVLAAACSGKLTADWREGEEGEHEVPNGWTQTSLGSISDLVTSGSRGWAKYYSASGALFIRAQNINSDFLDLSEIAYVTPPIGAEGARTQVRKNDLLITITGANVGKSAIVGVDLPQAFVSQHVGLVRLIDPKMSEFVILAILSPSHGRQQLLDLAYGQGKPGLNLQNLKDTRIPLPPLPEQEEIVRRVRALFALADTLEARYAKARAHVDKLTQAVLAKAFRGELVPTEAALARAEGRPYETAAALLERIRTERAAQPASARKRAPRKTARKRPP